MNHYALEHMTNSHLNDLRTEGLRSQAVQRAKTHSGGPSGKQANLSIKGPSFPVRLFSSLRTLAAEWI